MTFAGRIASIPFAARREPPAAAWAVPRNRPGFWTTSRTFAGSTRARCRCAGHSSKPVIDRPVAKCSTTKRSTQAKWPGPNACVSRMMIMPMVTPMPRRNLKRNHGSIDQRASHGNWWRELYPTSRRKLVARLPATGRQLEPDAQPRMEERSAVRECLPAKLHGDKPLSSCCGIQKPHVPFLAPDRVLRDVPRRRILKFTPASLEFWKTIRSSPDQNVYERDRIRSSELRKRISLRRD